MKLDAIAAARLFLLARGRGGDNAQEDLLALAQLLQEFAEAGYRRGVEETINNQGGQG